MFLRNISLWKLLWVLKRPNSRACALETIANFLALPVPCIPRPMEIARSREALWTRIELQPVKKGNLKLVPGLSILCDFETWLLKNDLANQETALMFYRQFFVYFSTIQLFFCELAWNFKISISNRNLYSNIRNSKFLAISVNFTDASIFDIHTCVNDKVYTCTVNMVLSLLTAQLFQNCALIRPTNHNTIF